MKDVFKMTFRELSAKSTEDITDWVESKDTAHHIAYYDLLGNLFFYKFKEDTENVDLAHKAKAFYELWLQKSQIFSLPVMSRIGELKEILQLVNPKRAWQANNHVKAPTKGVTVTREFQ